MTKFQLEKWKNNKDLIQKEKIKAPVSFTNLIQKLLNLDPHKVGP